jgi:hypothetical protein
MSIAGSAQKVAPSLEGGEPPVPSISAASWMLQASHKLKQLS